MLPLDRIAVLTFGADAVHYVRAVRVGRRVSVRRYEREPLAASGEQAALQRLVDRVRPASPYVVVSLDAGQERSIVLRMPALDNPEQQSAHARRALADHVPDPSLAHTLTVRSAALLKGRPEGAESEPGVTPHLVAAAHPDAVAARVAHVEQAGLTPLGIVPQSATDVLGLLTEAAFLEGRTSVLRLTASGATLLLCEQGTPVHQQVYYPSSPAAALLEADHHVRTAEAERFHGRAFTPSYVISDLPLPTVGAAGETPRTWYPLDPLATIGDEHLDGEALPAVAIALHYLDGAPPVDFLEEPKREAARSGREQRRGQRVSLAMGAMLLALLALAMTLEVVAEGAYTRAQAAFETVRPQVEAQEAAHAASRRRAAELQAARRLLSARTRTVLVLEAVARSVPPNVTLTHLTLVSQETGLVALGASGYVDNAAGPARFLSHLEMRSEIDAPRLVVVEQASAFERGSAGLRFDVAAQAAVNREVP